MAIPNRIEQVYLALFGRPADPVGLLFYNNLTHNGDDLTPILTGASRISGSSEYLNRFTGQTDAQIIATIFNSLFGHDPDAGGQAFYVAAMQNGEYLNDHPGAPPSAWPVPSLNGNPVPALTIEQIAVGILDGATGTDKTIIDHKTTAAAEFTAALDTPDETAAYKGPDANDFGRNFISHVGADPASVPTPSQVDTSVATLTNAAHTGVDVNLTMNTDTVSPTVAAPLMTSAANDIIHGTVASVGGTFNSGDAIDGGAGNDTLDVTHTDNIAVSVFASLTSVENVLVRNAGGGNVTLDANQWTGAKTIGLHDSTTGTTFINGLKNDVDVSFTRTGGSLDLNFAAGALGGAATLNVTVTNSAASLLTNVASSADKITTLKIDSEGVSGLTDNQFGYTGNDLTAVAVSGGRFIEIDLVNPAKIATFNASANTGGVDVDGLQNSNVDLTVTGTSASDTVRINLAHANTVNLGGDDDDLILSSLSNNGHLDGGTGHDSIEFVHNSDLATATATSAFEATISNFEKLFINDPVSSADLTVDLHNLDDIDDVGTAPVGPGRTLTLENFSSGGSIEVNGAVQLNGTLAVQPFQNTSNDTIHVNLFGQSIFGLLELSNFETVHFHTSDDIGVLHVDHLGSTATTITVDGVDGIQFGANHNALAGGPNLALFDASQVTGGAGIGDVYFNLSTDVAATLLGGNGNDFLEGFNHADTINGGAGNDIIIGDGGGDTLTGGAGADKFQYFNLANSTQTAFDTITDFSHAEGDKLDISQFGDHDATHWHVFTVASDASVAATINGGSAGSNHYIVFSQQSQTLFGSTDNVFDANDMAVHLTGVTAIDATDFIF